MEKFKDLAQDEDILAFADFLASQPGELRFPDYKAMDLMKIPRLVPNVWVLDFQNGLEDGLIVHFSGTKIDAHFGRNITGLDFEKIYPGEHKKELIEDS
ncbi:MAG: hypothetical protein ISR51_07615 [Rhodospirillales bacterium]|nr:hypothetical protein [Alphaproteobacteria bacterium]MBL6948529.1 hypothetical protein [Rhodospirillales bacterium]